MDVALKNNLLSRDLVLLATSCARFPNSLQLAHLPDGTRNLITEAIFSTSRQTIHRSVCNGLISTESNKLIGTKLSFQVNHSAICGIMMAEFVLDVMPVNAAFQRALSKDIVVEHLDLWSEVRFHIMNDQIYMNSGQFQ